MVCLIGPSGSGKITLIKSILRMEKMDESEAFILEKNMPNREISSKISYMA